MKEIRLILSVGLAILVGSAVMAKGSKPRAASGGEPVKKAGDTKVVSGEKGWKLNVYYLHGSYRCATCMSIERQSKEVAEGEFRKEIGAGKMVYQSLNFEEPDYAHFVTDYSLMTKSLVLSLRKDGKEVKWKNLPDIWSTVHTPDKFREYVAGEIKTMLAEMK